MPQSYFPVRGGAHPQTRIAAGATSNTDGDCEGCRQKAVEIERLRTALLRMDRDTSVAGPHHIATTAIMMWAGLGICAIGLLFALAAVLRHG